MIIMTLKNVKTTVGKLTPSNKQGNIVPKNPQIRPLIMVLLTIILIWDPNKMHKISIIPKKIKTVIKITLIPVII